MDLSKLPTANRCHIAFFGCTNAGKSSVVNAFCNQEVSIVSDIKGTTTDAVKKSMELLPFGPVVIIDTAGFDDNSVLGELRIKKTNEILDKTNVAILVVDILKGLNKKDLELINLFKNKNIPYIVAYNKSDLNENNFIEDDKTISISALTGYNINQLKDKVGKLVDDVKKSLDNKKIIIDKISPKDVVILVIPIDESAPKGRLILPQQLVLRELLDNHNSILISQTEELEDLINNQKTKPKLVITDSQAFNRVSKIVKNDIFLTSFSILFARYKGNLDILLKGADKISKLSDNSNILISEGCTHHRQCNDIGSVKIPKWLKEYSGKNLNFDFTSGNEFPLDLKKYDLIIHCGGCMLNEKEMQNRINRAVEQNVDIVNYGILISYLNGILDRAVEILK